MKPTVFLGDSELIKRVNYNSNTSFSGNGMTREAIDDAEGGTTGSRITFSGFAKFFNVALNRSRCDKAGIYWFELDVKRAPTNPIDAIMIRYFAQGSKISYNFYPTDEWTRIRIPVTKSDKSVPGFTGMLFQFGTGNNGYYKSTAKSVDIGRLSIYRSQGAVDYQHTKI